MLRREKEKNARVAALFLTGHCCRFAEWVKAVVRYLFQPGYYAIVVEHVIARELPHSFPNAIIFFTHWTFESRS